MNTSYNEDLKGYLKLTVLLHQGAQSLHTSVCLPPRTNSFSVQKGFNKAVLERGHKSDVEEVFSIEYFA